MSDKKKFNILITILTVLFYICWTISLIILYIEVFSKGNDKTVNVFVLGFSQAAWIYSILIKIKEAIIKWVEKNEEENTNILLEIKESK